MLDMSRGTHCAACHELVFLKLHLAFFLYTSCFCFNLRIIANRFSIVREAPSANLKKSDYSSCLAVYTGVVEPVAWTRSVAAIFQAQRWLMVCYEVIDGVLRVLPWQQGELFLLNQIFNENIRRLLRQKMLFAEEDVWYFRRKFGLIKNFSLLSFINWLIKMIPRILIFATIKEVHYPERRLWLT